MVRKIMMTAGAGGDLLCVWFVVVGVGWVGLRGVGMRTHDAAADRIESMRHHSLCPSIATLAQFGTPHQIYIAMQPSHRTHLKALCPFGGLRPPPCLLWEGVCPLYGGRCCAEAKRAGITSCRALLTHLCVCDVAVVRGQIRSSGRRVMGCGFDRSIAAGVHALAESLDPRSINPK